jgi:RNA polymerase-binding transcription factor DksA
MIQIPVCNRCGKSMEDLPRKKYCLVCKPIVEKELARIRSQRFRDRHGSENVLRWNREHPEQRRLIARNWMYRNAEKHKENLMRWRKKNPDKVRLQNQRAKKKRKLLMRKRAYYYGERSESLPLTDRISICKSCGREIPYSGHGVPRKYCDCCFPQIRALKNFLSNQKYMAKHPGGCNAWYRNNKELIVAVTCILCDDIIPGHGGKKICHRCSQKWGRRVPRFVKESLAAMSSFNDIPKDIIVWKRIIDLRNQGIYSLSERHVL